MPTIATTIKRLLPDGSNSAKNWSDCPAWPPDAFAVVATLIEEAGSYAKRDLVCPWTDHGIFCDDPGYQDRVKEQARRWVEDLWPSPATKALWQRIWKERGSFLVGSTATHCADWEIAALELLAVTDEASFGMGFSGSSHVGSKRTPEQQMSFNLIVMNKMVEHQRTSEGKSRSRKASSSLLRYYPNSLCVCVPSDVACVQPKTNTPKVGCTVRSLSHNLALLPGIGTVETIWRFGMEDVGNEVGHPRHRPLNVLLLPVPYELHGSAFAEVRKLDGSTLSGGSRGYFTVDQSWLRDERTGQSLSAEIAAWTQRMVEEARRAVGTVHAVVFPEAALDWATFDEVGKTIAQAFPADFELLIAGLMIEEDGVGRNVAATRRYQNGDLLIAWPQSKHHRWRLESNQIRGYHFGHALSPNREWWEAIDISRRQCIFAVVRPGASLAVLICEDLARVDPVLPAINAIGPNLLIALLMDSAQLNTRWPARYASVLAEDPGCAVLTFTSAGPISRARPMKDGDDGRRAVALWKEPSGSDARTLYMEPGSRGLVLSLVAKNDIQYTLDGRSDLGAAQAFSLGSAVSVRGPDLPTRREKATKSSHIESGKAAVRRPSAKGARRIARSKSAGKPGSPARRSGAR